MNALDDLLADFESNAGTLPKVNPPESASVLAAQTAPEVAGEPEPAPVDVAPPAPTEKPAEVKAAEAAKARKPRAQKPADNAPAGQTDGALAKEYPGLGERGAIWSVDGCPESDELTLAVLALIAKLPRGGSVKVKVL